MGVRLHSFLRVQRRVRREALAAAVRRDRRVLKIRAAVSSLEMIVYFILWYD